MVQLREVEVMSDKAVMKSKNKIDSKVVEIDEKTVVGVNCRMAARSCPINSATSVRSIIGDGLDDDVVAGQMPKTTMSAVVRPPMNEADKNAILKED